LLYCDEDYQYCGEQIGVKAFPEIRMFSGGFQALFQEEDTGAQSVASWIAERLDNKVSEVSSNPSFYKVFLRSRTARSLQHQGMDLQCLYQERRQIRQLRVS
jgi:hypothetical protein